MGQMILLSLFSGSFFTIKNGLIVALIVGFLCLFLLIAFVWYYFATKWTDKDIKKIINSSIKEPSGSVHEAIRKMILDDYDIMNHLSSRNHSNQSPTQAEIERIVQKQVDKALEGLQKKQYDEFIQPVADEAKPVEEVSKSNSSFLYASCVDEKKRSFYTVTKFPDKDTIFILELNPEDENEATFTVYDKVFKKVIGEQGYLRDGCTIENPGMNTTTRVRTKEPGLTYCKNGEWVVKEQAKVKFE